MNVERLKEVLSVPTCSGREEQMVKYLCDLGSRQLGVRWFVDKHNNVILKKGDSPSFACVAAHIDSVQPIEQKFTVTESGGLLIAKGNKGQRVGFGADDKVGVYIALELFDRFDTIAAAFFAGEEVGCRGSGQIQEYLLNDIGWLIEFDCPAKDMFSYTAGGMRLFDDEGGLIHRAAPILNRYGINKWQRHPYTDVTALRRRFPFSCMNVSSGYYRWHAPTEYVKISDTANTLEMATELIKAVGNTQHHYKFCGEPEKPLVPVTNLILPKEEELQVA